MRIPRPLTFAALFIGLSALVGCGKGNVNSVPDRPDVELKGDPTPEKKPPDTPVAPLPKGKLPVTPPEQVPVAPADKARLEELEKKGAAVFGPLANGGYIVRVDRDADAAALLPLFKGLKGVVELAIENEALTDERLQYLDGFEYLESVSFLRCSKLTGTGFGVFAKLPRLKTFASTECPLTDAACKSLGRCKKLEDVAFSHSQITDAGLRALSELPVLGSLSLYATPIAGWAFETPGWAKLKFIEAPNSSFDDTGLMAVSGLPALENLDLRLTKVTDTGAKSLDRAKKLTDLVLNDTAVGNAALSAIGELPALKELHLEGTKVTDAGVVALGRTSTLQVLNLEQTAVTGAAFAGFSQPSALRKLNLNNTKFGDASGPHLARFPALTNLSLRACPVTDDGLTALSALKKLTNLDLSGTKAGDGAAKLVGALPELETASFDGTRLTDAGVKDAAQGPALKFLKARDTKVTKRGAIEAGKFAREGVKIVVE